MPEYAPSLYPDGFEEEPKKGDYSDYAVVEPGKITKGKSFPQREGSQPPETQYETGGTTPPEPPITPDETPTGITNPNQDNKAKLRPPQEKLSNFKSIKQLPKSGDNQNTDRFDKLQPR